MSIEGGGGGEFPKCFWGSTMCLLGSLGIRQPCWCLQPAVLHPEQLWQLGNTCAAQRGAEEPTSRPLICHQGCSTTAEHLCLRSSSQPPHPCFS